MIRQITDTLRHIGGGVFIDIAIGINQITYRCTDNRIVQVDCANAKGCWLTP